MRIQVLSALHMDRCNPQRAFEEAEAFPPFTGDVLLLAADIGHGAKWMKSFSEVTKPMLLIPGHTGFYHSTPADSVEALRREASVNGMMMLDNKTICLENVRFIGTTLWSDFSIFPSTTMRPHHVHRSAGAEAGILERPGSDFSLKDAVALHQKASDWLQSELFKPFNGKTVVVSYFAPRRKSVPLRFLESLFGLGLVSHLSYLAGRADVWVHGRTHSSLDCNWKGTSALCNARGNLKPLPWEAPGRQDWPHFVPDFSFEI